MCNVESACTGTWEYNIVLCLFNKAFIYSDNAGSNDRTVNYELAGAGGRILIYGIVLLFSKKYKIIIWES
jgi:hypothetical protein